MDVNVSEKQVFGSFVKRIFDFQTSRDSYFIRFSNKTVFERDIFLNEQIERLLADIKESADKDELSKADFCYLSGKLLNLCPGNNYDAKCEEFLSKSVKLNPNHTDSWNELGECLWRKRDVAGAKNCFESALQKVKNKVCLRNLSIILRQMAKSCSNTEKDSINQSFNYAKEALALDADDPVNILGNAYLTLFFYSAQTKIEYITGALDCYQKAAKDESARVQYNADLYFNQAVALRYEENYRSCLESFRKAVALDPSFVSANQQLTQLLTYLPQIYDNVIKKGKIKAKRLQQLTSSICRQTDLGPFIGGQYRSKSGLKIELTYSPIQDLQLGPNMSKVCLGRVVASIFNENVIPLTFCIVDETGYCTAVTVYNFQEKFGVAIGQSVAIAEPYFANIEIDIDDKILKFPSIRVSTPELLVINGRKCGRNFYASTDIVVSKE